MSSSSSSVTSLSTLPVIPKSILRNMAKAKINGDEDAALYAIKFEMVRAQFSRNRTLSAVFQERYRDDARGLRDPELSISRSMFAKLQQEHRQHGEEYVLEWVQERPFVAYALALRRMPAAMQADAAIPDEDEPIPSILPLAPFSDAAVYSWTVGQGCGAAEGQVANPFFMPGECRTAGAAPEMGEAFRDAVVTHHSAQIQRALEKFGARARTAQDFQNAITQYRSGLSTTVGEMEAALQNAENKRETARAKRADVADEIRSTFEEFFSVSSMGQVAQHVLVNDWLTAFDGLEAVAFTDANRTRRRIEEVARRITVSDCGSFRQYFNVMHILFAAMANAKWRALRQQAEAVAVAAQQNAAAAAAGVAAPGGPLMPIAGAVAAGAAGAIAAAAAPAARRVDPLDDRARRQEAFTLNASDLTDEQITARGVQVYCQHDTRYEIVFNALEHYARTEVSFLLYIQNWETQNAARLLANLKVAVLEYETKHRDNSGLKLDIAGIAKLVREDSAPAKGKRVKRGDREGDRPAKRAKKAVKFAQTKPKGKPVGGAAVKVEDAPKCKRCSKAKRPDRHEYSECWYDDDGVIVRGPLLAKAQAGGNSRGSKSSNRGPRGGGPDGATAKLRKELKDCKLALKRAVDAKKKPARAKKAATAAAGAAESDDDSETDFGNVQPVFESEEDDDEE